MILRHLFLLGLAVICALAVSQTASAQPIAMVTDLKGEGWINGNELSLLDEISAGDRITLQSGNLVIVYYAHAIEYVVNGPAKLRVNRNSPDILSGAPAVKRDLFAGKTADLVIQPASVAQATIIMRGEDDSALTLLSPISTKLSSEPVVFRWLPVTDAETYRLTISDNSGRVVHRSETPATSYVLSAEINLRPGRTYRWEVRTLDRTNRLQKNWSVFEIATDQERAAIDILKPGAGASFSERVVYARLLDQHAFHEAAQALWETLLAERNEPALRAAIRAMPPR